MEFTTEFLQVTDYRRPKSTLIQFSLGRVRTVAKGVQTDNCATGFPNSLIILS
jgi:hypothetical protein